MLIHPGQGFELKSDKIFSSRGKGRPGHANNPCMIELIDRRAVVSTSHFLPR